MNTVLASCTPELEVANALGPALDALRAALDDLTSAYTAPIPPLVPRPALILLSHIACSTFLLEHAVWACEGNVASRHVDVDVFKRWVEEEGLAEVVSNTRRAMQAQPQRLEDNRDVVFGVDTGALKLSSRL